jgi:hypothetical protein
MNVYRGTIYIVKRVSRPEIEELDSLSVRQRHDNVSENKFEPFPLIIS